MKRILIILSLLFVTTSSFAQNKFAGNWVGKMNAGQEVETIFHITGDKELTATFDIPAQGAVGIKCSKVSTDGEKITITIDQIKVTYEGEAKDDKHIEGKWNQSGMSITLNLEKSDKVKKLNRPQTPKPPFSYNSEDVIYNNADKSMQYGATITTPKDGKKHPALILITGSGAQDRDESAFGHKPFAVIADHLTKNGYVILRVDDRGVGQTTKVKGSTSADFAKDVLAGVEYLKSRKEVDIKKIGLLGHSEGGMIAPLVASESKDVDFIILFAGPGVKVSHLMTEQNVAVLQSMGLPEPTAQQYGKLYLSISEVLSTAPTKEDAEKNIHKAIDKWKGETDNTVVVMTTGISDSASQQTFANNFIKLYDSKWFRYFLSYDPASVLNKISCKVLALNGEKDIQVLPKSNLAGIEAGLKNSKSKNYTVTEVPGVNHMFQECNACTAQEYGQLEQTIKPEVLDMVTTWLNKNVK